MRADFTAIPPDTAGIAVSRTGGQGAGPQGEGTNDFILALLGAMAQMEISGVVQGEKSEDIMAALPGSHVENAELLTLYPGNAEMPANHANLTAAQINPFLGSGSVPPVLVEDENAALATGIQLAETGQRQTAVPSGNTSGYALQQQVPSGPLVSRELNSNASPVASQFSVNYSTVAPPDKVQAVLQSNTELTIKGVQDNSGGGGAVLITAGADGNTDKGMGFGGYNGGGQAGKEDQHFGGLKQADQVYKAAPEALAKTESNQMPSSRPEVQDSLGKVHFKNNDVNVQARLTPEQGKVEKMDFAAGIQEGNTEIQGKDGRYMAVDGGQVREQVQVNAGSIHIQSITSKKFPAEILPHVLSTVQNAGHENRVTVIRLKLEPQNMGEINIKLSYVKGELTAHFFTGSALVKEAVESSLPQLRETLSQHNVQLGEAQAHVGQEKQGHQGSGYTGFGYSGGKFKLNFNKAGYLGQDSEVPSMIRQGGSQRMVNILV